MVNTSDDPNYRTPFLTTYQFLKLTQPVDEASLPVPRIAEKGRTYTFQFTFVVPDRLLPNACTHRHKNQSVQDAHLRLPPSLGDATAPSVGGVDYDDIAPTMSRVSYAIHARLLQRKESDGKLVDVGSQHRRVRVLPTYEELPPQIVDDKSQDLALVKERTIRKGLLKGKLGKLTVAAQQPRPLQTTLADHLSTTTTPSTVIPITVTFKPSSATDLPPTLNMLTTKLRVFTFFTTYNMQYFPSPSSILIDGTLGRYFDTLFLGTKNLGGVKWVHRPDSNTYTADITLPIITPKYKSLLPTFYSCLVARSYLVDINLDVHTPGYNMGAHPGVTLHVPLQVASADAAGGLPAQLPSDEQADEHLPGFGDEFFTPRRVGPAAVRENSLTLTESYGSSGTDSDAASSDSHQLPPHMRARRANMPPPPPGYSFFAGATQARPVRIPEPIGVSPGCG